jgi:hypothetical protein
MSEEKYLFDSFRQPIVRKMWWINVAELTNEVKKNVTEI